jgi:large subunit ribosomal protein L22
MELRYSIPVDEGAVKAMGRDMNVSFKDMIIVAETIRGMRLAEAIRLLEDVKAKKKPIQYRRFQAGIGHRKGNQPKIAKYPVKAASYALEVLENLQGNAEFKGLDPENVSIIHSQAQHGVSRPRRKPKGRYKVRETEFVHLQVVGREI